MAETKKYYWLKLKRDFFKRHDIRIIEEMPNGKDYILFYLKLLLESIDHEGTLRFSDAIPYNEQMLSVVTNTNIDIVRSAMKIFIDLNMIDIFDDKTIYMTEVDKLIGSETEWAKKKRVQRAKEDNVPKLSPKCPTEIELEKEKKSETDLELDVAVATGGNIGNFELQNGTLGKGVVLLTPEQNDALLDKLGFDGYNHYVAKLADFIIENDAKVGNHYATILKWAKQDSQLTEVKT
jgi:predicted phage replisome organizer